MLDLAGMLTFLSARIPELVNDRDSVIVIVSARLSIALIPVALIWFLASNFARWMATAFALGKLLNLPDALDAINSWSSIDPTWLVSTMLGLFSVMMLFMPDAKRWFAKKGISDAAPFE